MTWQSRVPAVKTYLNRQTRPYKATEPLWDVQRETFNAQNEENTGSRPRWLHTNDETDIKVAPLLIRKHTQQTLGCFTATLYLPACRDGARIVCRLDGYWWCLFIMVCGVDNSCCISCIIHIRFSLIQILMWTWDDSIPVFLIVYCGLQSGRRSIVYRIKQS